MRKRRPEGGRDEELKGTMSQRKANGESKNEERQKDGERNGRQEEKEKKGIKDKELVIY